MLTLRSPFLGLNACKAGKKMSRYLLSPHAQGTPEWLQDRAGRVTGSAVKALYASVKTGEAAARSDYRYQLAIERLTGTPAPSGFVSAEMQWGTDQEPFARMATIAELGEEINEAGFAYWEWLEVGSSVDGFFADGGIWENKSPKSATHIGYLTAGYVPADYMPQVTHNVWVTGAPYAVFTSFDPRLPEHLQLFTVRVEAADLPLAEHEAKVKQFLKETEELVNQLQNIRRK